MSCDALCNHGHVSLHHPKIKEIEKKRKKKIKLKKIDKKKRKSK